MKPCSSPGTPRTRVASPIVTPFLISALLVIGNAQAAGGKAEQHYDTYRDVHGIERDVSRAEEVTTPSQTPSDKKDATRQPEKDGDAVRDAQTPCAKGKLTAPLTPFPTGRAPGAQHSAQLRCV